MTDRTKTKAMRKGVVLAIVVLMAGAALATSATAQAQRGTIKVHDDEFVEPMTRNDPHVSCDFWIFGHQLNPNSDYTLEFQKKQEQGPFGPVVVSEDVTTDNQGEFNEGPFNFTVAPGPGMYKVTILDDEGDKVSSKVFRVNPCPPNGDGPPPCPPGLNATAIADPVSIELDWDAVEGAVEYRIYRAVEGGDLQPYATVPATQTEFTDFNVTVGVTYQYMVTAFDGQQESQNCEIVEATAIPFFNGAVGQLVAIAGSVGAMVALRRRLE